MLLGTAQMTVLPIKNLFTIIHSVELKNDSEFLRGNIYELQFFSTNVYLIFSET